MDKSKLFRYISLGIIVMLAVIVAIYGLLYFNARTKEIKDRLVNLEPKIIVPSQSCDIPTGSTRGWYNIMLRSTDIDKAKKSAEEFIVSAGGVVNSINDATYLIYEDKINQTILEREVRLSISLSNDQSKSFITAIKGLAKNPNVFENETSNIETYNSIRGNCQNLLGMIKNFSEQEGIYLNQLQSDIPFEKRQEIMNELMRLRQDVASYAREIEYVTQNLNKFEVTITIREILG